MKQIIKLAGIFAMAVAAVSCNVDDIDNTIGIPFQLYASAEAETKTSIDDNMKTTWAENDQINVFHAVAGSNEYVSDGAFTSTDATSNLFEGKLQGELSEATSYDWYAFYPYDSYIKTPASRNSGYICVGANSNKSQVQNGNNSFSHICGVNVPLYGRVLGVAESDIPQIQMHQLASVVKVNVTNNTQAPLKVATVSFTGTENIVGTYYIDITNETPIYTKSGDSYVSDKAILEVANGSEINNGESASFYIVIKPFTAPERSKIKVAVNGYEKEINITKDTPFTAGKIKTINFNFDNIITPVIPDGDYAILAKDGDDYYALSTDANASSKRRDRVSVTYNGGESFETTNSKLIWSFTASGNTYTIANGTDYMGVDKNTIPLITESNAAEVTIVDNGDGTYTLTADCGSDGTRYMAMNDINGFAWYASTTGVNTLYLVPASYTVPTLYNISVCTTTNGTVTASREQAEAGENITLTVTPDSGYKLATLTYNGTDIASVKSFVMPAENVTIAATFEEEALGELKTWTYSVTTASPVLNSSNPSTVNGATWSIAMGEMVGAPSVNGDPTKYAGILGWKWGSSKSAYWASYTLSTDYFASKKVKSVTVNFLNNGSKAGTMTVMQGSTTIGTASATFGNVWTDLTANTTQGTSGTLTIEYTVAQASYIHSITVEYYE